jgi:hypothetical protein
VSAADAGEGPVTLDADSVARDLAPHHPYLPPADLLELAGAILLEVQEAIRKGDQVATIHVNPNGTFEISYIRVGPRKDGRHNGSTRLFRGVTGQ